MVVSSVVCRVVVYLSQSVRGGEGVWGGEEEKSGGVGEGEGNREGGREGGG